MAMFLWPLGHRPLSRVRPRVLLLFPLVEFQARCASLFVVVPRVAGRGARRGPARCTPAVTTLPPLTFHAVVRA
ncbi:hypothetical protein E2C01_047859 [Portunus trituberculatus]|uniref:Uncharacterized protein n=1 Tax=Portunus trituberculatus TaxID=210409 RepID=A0A5B7G9M4_PORTR|nr:hypothetical protein [Portunus trituberculatus]